MKDATLKFQGGRAVQQDTYMSAVRALEECYFTCQKVFIANTPKEAGMSLPYLHLKRLQACSTICESTARLLLKDGIDADRLCEIAARICEQCAHSCEQMATESMKRVARICRQTADICLDESYRIKRAA